MARPIDPLGAARFLLEIDGISIAAFSECTLPDSTQDNISWRVGNESNGTREIPSLIKYGNLTLKWGLTDSMDLYNWRAQVEKGETNDARRNIAVILMNGAGESKSRWEFEYAWPTKYDAPDLNATGSDIAVETLEIAHEGMKRIT